MTKIAENSLDWRRADLSPRGLRAAISGGRLPGATTAFRLLARTAAAEGGATGESVALALVLFERVGGAAHLDCAPALAFLAGPSSPRPDVWRLWLRWALLDAENGLASLEPLFETAGYAARNSFDCVQRVGEAVAANRPWPPPVVRDLDAALKASNKRPRGLVLSAALAVAETLGGPRKRVGSRDAKTILARYAAAMSLRDSATGLPAEGREALAAEALVNLLARGTAAPE